MPPTTRKTAPRNGPAKKAAPKRVRKDPAEKAAEGIAAKRAATKGEDKLDPYAPTAWGADEGIGTLVDLELPSGQLVLAQRPGPEGLMAAGMLDDLDMLAGMLPANGKPAIKKLDLKQLSTNAKGLQQAMALLNRVTVHVVIKPELTPEPENPADKVRGNIYPSSVGMEDKVFLFNWACGGTRDLSRFREQFTQSVENVATGPDVEGTTE